MKQIQRHQVNLWVQILFIDINLDAFDSLYENFESSIKLYLLWHLPYGIMLFTLLLHRTKFFNCSILEISIPFPERQIRQQLRETVNLLDKKIYLNKSIYERIQMCSTTFFSGNGKCKKRWNCCLLWQNSWQ